VIPKNAQQRQTFGMIPLHFSIYVHYGGSLLPIFPEIWLKSINQFYDPIWLTHGCHLLHRNQHHTARDTRIMITKSAAFSPKESIPAIMLIIPSLNISTAITNIAIQVI